MYYRENTCLFQHLKRHWTIWKLDTLFYNCLSPRTSCNSSCLRQNRVSICIYVKLLLYLVILMQLYTLNVCRSISLYIRFTKMHFVYPWISTVQMSKCNIISYYCITWLKIVPTLQIMYTTDPLLKKNFKITFCTKTFCTPFVSRKLVSLLTGNLYAWNNI